MNLFQFLRYQLFRPLSFLQISFRGRWLVFFAFPLTLAGLCILPTLFFGVEVFIGDDGVVSNINSIIASLPGFFIAALAAVATFNKPEIDKELTPPIKIEISINDQMRPVSVTRRRLMCMLFSYLTFLSLFTSIFTTILLHIPTPLWVPDFALALCSGFYIFIMWHMLFVTLIGLYYLGERLHNST